MVTDGEWEMVHPFVFGTILRLKNDDDFHVITPVIDELEDNRVCELMVPGCMEWYV